MKINSKGLILLKSFEGFETEAYQDSVGVWTVGYGHTGDDVYGGLSVTPSEIDELLYKDLERFESGVDALVTAEINENQFSALVCFSFNVGLHNLESSHLLQKVNDNDFSGASEEFGRWNKAGGKELLGLTRRRAAEKALFELPVS